MGFKLKFWFTPGPDEAPIAYTAQGAGNFGSLVARKLSSELGYPVTCHPNAELPLNMNAGSSHVWRVTWFDESAEVYREGWAVLRESFPGDECSVCRQWHGLEVIHAAE